MLHNLQVGIEHIERMRESLENEISFISGVDLEEDRTNVVFNELLNQPSHEPYPDCSKFSSLNFLVTMMHVKVLKCMSNKCFDMILQIIKRAFLMCGTNAPGSFYEAKHKLRELGLRFETIHAYKYECIVLEGVWRFATCGESRYMVSSNNWSSGKKSVESIAPLSVNVEITTLVSIARKLGEHEMS